MTHCSGMYGKRCTCGSFHSPEAGPQDGFAFQETAVRSLLAKPAFWIGGALSLLPWLWVLAWVMR